MIETTRTCSAMSRAERCPSFTRVIIMIVTMSMMTKFYLYDNEYDGKVLSLVIETMRMRMRKTSASPFLTGPL